MTVTVTEAGSASGGRCAAVRQPELAGGVHGGLAAVDAEFAVDRTETTSLEDIRLDLTNTTTEFASA